MKNPRRLWLSVIVVTLVSSLALAGLWLGRLSPSLGLDLQGGVAVILSAPDGTPSEVMDQALENIRRRVDGFGVAEPDIFTSGTTIEVQIPGATDSTLETRPADTYCVLGVDAEDVAINLGCNEDEEVADDALAGLVPTSRPTEVCLVSGEEELGCFGSQEEAVRQQGGITIVGKNDEASPSASGSPSASASPTASPSVGPGGAFDEYCLTDFANEDLACYDSQAEAQAVLDDLEPEVTEREWCIAPEVEEPEPTSTPTPTETPSSTGSSSDTPCASESPSPTAEEVFGQLTDATDPLPCSFETKTDAEAALDDTSVEHVTQRYCVVSSQGEDLGCFVDRGAAEERQRETGQQRLLAVIGQTARLEERATLEIVSPQDPRYATLPLTCGTPEEQESEECQGSALDDQEVVYLDADGNKVRLGPVIISGGNIEQASGQLVSTTGTSVPEWVVTFDLDDEGSDAFAAATRAALTAPAPQNQIAIVVDRTIVSNPTVTGVIDTGTGQITGGFSEETARDLGTVLSAGALPVELTIESVRTVSPTLGEESLTQGVIAGIAGLLLLLLYLLLYYRLLGVVAWLGMTIWSILALALVSVAGDQFGYSLTLAGVAGLIISLGVTADSYIVFFERLKDELRGGKSPRTVVQPAFKRALRTIVAADVVTFIAAAVLYVTAVSSVRGFALTLGIATLLDLFVVYFFKRPTVFLLTRSKRLASMKAFGLAAAAAVDHEATPTDAGGRSRLRHFMDTYRGYVVPNFRIVERMKRWFVFSGVLIALSLIGLAAVRINLSIDFEGGTLLTYPLRSDATVEDIQATLEDAGVERAEVQIVTDSEGESVVIRGESIPDEEGSTLREDLAEQGGVALDDVSSETVGPTWGSEVSRTALRGLIIVLLLIAGYIAFRFQPAMALGAMIALVHDVVITGGIYALTAREVTPETVIAVLTILGFSLYDTVVIYDKIQENTESPALMARMSYPDVVNLSLNQTLMRSVNTSLVVLLPIASLLLFGGDTLKDFAFAMFVGVTIGAYSSIFIAAPVLVLLRRRSADTSPSPVPRSSRQAVVAAAAAEGAVTSVPPTGPSRPRPKGKRRPQPKRKRR